MTFRMTVARWRALGSAAGVAALTTALAVPAGAEPGCDGLAADSADYEAELWCASESTDGEQVITLTDSFTVSPEAENVYNGSQPLTITAEPGVVVSGSAEAATDDIFTGSFLLVPPAYEPLSTVEPLSIEGGDEPIDLDSLDAPAQAQALIEEVAPLAEPSALPASITIQDVTLRDFADFGVIAVLRDAPLHISGSTFADNGPELDLSSEPIFEAAFLSTVSAAGDVVIEDSLFTGNSGFYGAGVSNIVSELMTGGERGSYPGITVSDSTFEGNTGLLGSAVLSIGAVDARRSTFADNAGLLGSAIIAGNDLLIEDSTIAGNDARPQSEEEQEISGDGGAVAVLGAFESGADATVSVVNSTFADNVSPLGTLIAPSVGALTIDSSTFAGNTVESEQGADLVLGTAEHATIAATVFASDAAACATDGDSAIATSYVFDDGSCTDGWAGEGDLGDGLDAQLGALADNGGPTATLLPAAASPLVDAVPADALVAALDQRGVTRPQGDAADIGAVELEPSEAEEPAVGETIDFQVVTPGGTLSGTASPAIAVTDVAWVDIADLPMPPAGVATPFGAATFAVEVPAAGDTVTVTLTAPRPFTGAFKVSGAGWEAIEAATLSADGMTITYALTDGGPLDEDGEANGIIVDPVALAVQATFTG
ncbi:choice-of-anchor U domain-containing protein [Demequina sp. NBRC 110053]|uniref:choice-of-anchor U domain-containing protein n=1 Tax=Demequina sp. NBRC 110053 TaxID=1570342 RepID=UPI0011865CFF|nr:choice-of-anchor U domain-containing protein [Demequina sp. NBRC 110053]